MLSKIFKLYKILLCFNVATFPLFKNNYFLVFYYLMFRDRKTASKEYKRHLQGGTRFFALPQGRCGFLV